MRRQDKPRREPRTLAQQLQPDTIECMSCERIKPAAGSRKFHAWGVCADCISDITKRTEIVRKLQESK